MTTDPPPQTSLAPAFESENLRFEMPRPGVGMLSFDVPGRTYNVLSLQVLADLDAALETMRRTAGLKVLVLVSRKKSGFFAGADLHEFGRIRSPAEAVALSERGQRLLQRLAELAAPSVAVIHGPCLGGGLELALACDYRIAVDLPTTQLGLPEIKLGLIPGWGGTQRLPRVVGLERALQAILQQRLLSADEAKAWGLVDAVSPSVEQALEALPLELARKGKAVRQGLPLRGWRQRLLESTSLGRAVVLGVAAKLLKRRLPDDMPAPLEALEAVRVGLREGLEAGLARERQAIGDLATTPACRNLVTLFFLVERARSTNGGATADAVADLVSAHACSKIGVVGAGTMGAGIAQLALLKGFEVVVREINDTALAAGLQRVKSLLDKAVERKLLTSDEARRKLASLGRTTTWRGFDDADVVIEAAIEDLETKRDLFRTLDACARPDAILATNTSALSVRKLQEGLQRSDRVAGLHFFNPVHKMPLVEVVRTPTTRDDVVRRLTMLAAALGKTPVVVSDRPGFLVNRILTPYLNEAGILLSEGLPLARIDQAMRRFGMPMGPFELLDQVGLDVAAHVARAVAPAFGARLTPHPALERMVAYGWLGQKSGKGFYRYRGKVKVVHRLALARLRDRDRRLLTHRDRRPLADRLREARDRMVWLMVNEAACCLGEGLVDRPETIDLGMVLGAGWAPHRGGPLRYADDVGLAQVVVRLDDLAKRLGPRFTPCDELRRRATSGRPFYEALDLPGLPSA